MLQGMRVDPNPMQSGPEVDKLIEIVYEDDDIAVINKPHELLSIPGKLVRDSVEERMKILFPQAGGPMIVHRLDMSTSGIMLIAKNLKSFHVLQQQFIKRTLKKTYVALLSGVPLKSSGTVNLPLRVDLDDRPRQMVCYEHGKEAVTHWEVESILEGKAKVRFYPVTGRTHQLRVHAAHALGLNCPIVGDDIYGQKGDRLYLHAQEITFRHPAGKQQMTIRVQAPF
jgi:tRNA pseudouridine32 synthase/23S rRNA pseudouridine746 synthase